MNRLRVFVPFAIGYFLSNLFRVLNAVIAPDLVGDLGLDATDLGLLTSIYFVTFAAFQVPLGILLDRFGPRRTEASLLVVASLGAFVFAAADSLPSLMVGRALIGLGVSACLMAAFKAFVVWFPGERLPTVNGLQLAIGGLGVVAGTAPVEAALHVIDWRGLFTALGAAAAIAAAVILVVPEHKHGAAGTPLRDQVAGVADVFTSPVFWRIAPMCIMSGAAFLSIQGLWAGPWLRDVAGLDRASVADHLFLMAATMVAGFVLFGAAAERLGRRGVRPIAVAAVGTALFILVQGAIVAEWTEAVTPLWSLFGFLGTAGLLVYPILSQAFPAHLAGRVNTALNLLVFVGAFAAQWGVGAVIDLWPERAGGGYDPAAYRVAFGILLGLETLGLGWVVVAWRRGVKA